MDLYVQQLLSGLTLGGIYALIAVGYTMIFKVSSIMNFAHGDLVMVGALISLSAAQSLGLPLLGALLVSMLCMIVIGMLMERLVIRPVAKRSVLAPTIITLGVGFLLQGSALVGWGPLPQAMNPFLKGAPYTIFGANVSGQATVVLLTSMVTAILLWLFLERTLIGKALRACNEDRYGATLCGINPARMVAIAFAIAGILAALAGFLIMPITGISYDSGGHFTLRALTAAVIGGLQSNSGSFLGGLMVGVLDAFSAGFAPAYQDVIVFTVLVVFLLVRPNGLLGRTAT